jgi:hypothetical protein
MFLLIFVDWKNSNNKQTLHAMHCMVLWEKRGEIGMFGLTIEDSGAGFVQSRACFFLQWVLKNHIAANCSHWPDKSSFKTIFTALASLTVWVAWKIAVCQFSIFNTFSKGPGHLLID